MGDVTWRFDASWFNEMRNSQAVQDLCLEQAERVLGQCPDGLDYSCDVQPGRLRAQAMVKTGDFDSRLDNQRNNTLARALGGSL